MDAPQLTPPFRERLVAGVRAQLPTVMAIYLYGSVADATARSDSDIDIAVLLPPGEAIPVPAQFAMAAFEGYPTDLIDLRRVGAILQREVLNKGIRIFASDPLLVAIAESYLLSISNDDLFRIQPYYDMIQNEVLHRRC
ncbi:MAG: nucleotidyltransferase domain-containing protein [Fimbriimonadaceae bacterium]|nr:nucleotidyltransferase domain-containing protein [Fimbriimonadaceae bacterium]